MPTDDKYHVPTTTTIFGGANKRAMGAIRDSMDSIEYSADGQRVYRSFNGRIMTQADFDLLQEVFGTPGQSTSHKQHPVNTKLPVASKSQQDAIQTLPDTHTTYRHSQTQHTVCHDRGLAYDY